MRESAIALATRIIELIGQPYDIDGHKMVVGASIGIAMAPHDGADPDELMKKADLALYKTKSEGRNGYSLLRPGTGGASPTSASQLEAGPARGARAQRIRALLPAAGRRRDAGGRAAWKRWSAGTIPSEGLIAPDHFIPLAEDTGLIISLGEWILQTACTEAANWPADVKVAVNISPVQFRKSNLFDVIMCALVDSGLPPERLEIEITERVLLENDADYLSTLHQLKNLGISIALDDFGTGYSSLGYLKMFPFDKIKIDRSFTQELLGAGGLRRDRLRDHQSWALARHRHRRRRGRDAGAVRGVARGRRQPGAGLSVRPSDAGGAACVRRNRR